MRYLTLLMSFLFLFSLPLSLVAQEEVFDLGSRSANQWQLILEQAARIESAGEKIAYLSGQFLAVPYRSDTLVGDTQTAEVLVVNLARVDCFTLLDYVEALRRSPNLNGFKQNLKLVRYQQGQVAYANRNHFLTDWRHEPLTDVTRQVGGEKTQSVVKTLNTRADGSLLLPGISPKERVIHYLPASVVDEEILERLKQGDYMGVYSPLAGLDVSHAGIIIRKDDGVYLRHASSSKESSRVIDSELLTYLAGKSGLVVLRVVSR